MQTPMLDYVLQNLDAAKGRWPVISEKTGIPYKTLVKVAQSETKNPGIDSVQRLYDYFREQQAA